MIGACILSFGTGFLSLALEILWVRLFTFANATLPQSFAYVLIWYLLGIAFGAKLGKRISTQSKNLWQISGTILIFAGLFDMLSPWIFALVLNMFEAYQAQLIAGGILIFLTAYLKAIIFPIAHHLAVSSSHHVGRKISRVYVANIMGATLGPLMVGFILLAYFSTQECFFICGYLALLLAIFCLQKDWSWFKTVSHIGSVTLIFILSLFINANSLVFYTSKVGAIRRIIENQYGIVITYYGGKAGDYVTGNNVYDGRTNLDPIINSNGLERLYVLSVLKDNPKNVLVIGLSIGTWLKLLTAFPGVKNIDVIEINPGYLQAMVDYPKQMSALSDGRVQLYFADARRWLKVHPNKRYDLVVMNATFHWRAFAGNLLSTEFLTLLKQHMNRDALLAYNATGSPDVLKTAVQVFQHAYFYDSFVFAADYDWRSKIHTRLAHKKLAQFTLDGQLFFPKHSDKLIDFYLTKSTVAIDTVENFYHALGRNVEVITDDNLITEYKYGKTLW